MSIQFSGINDMHIVVQQNLQNSILKVHLLFELSIITYLPHLFLLSLESTDTAKVTCFSLLLIPNPQIPQKLDTILYLVLNPLSLPEL